ncbi:MAG TPA: polysaccharide deacetylase family protein [Flavitalea sp.]|nr:polysaccharide deacetylase family protein [Flavitalea sp.]
MLTFRNTNIFFGAVAVFLLVMQIWFHIPAYLYLGLLLLYIATLAYGSYNVDSNFFMKVICSADTKEKIIALSFDDGPVHEYTPHVLEILKEEKVPAAFFCIGKRIVENENLFRQIHMEGHVIGNHSYSHTPLFDMMPSDRMLEDVQKTDEAIKKSIGLHPKLFRPPYGVTTPAMKKVMNRGGYTAIGWNIRSLDTIARNDKQLLNKLIRLLRPGAVILLHDTQKITLSILPRFIRAARNEGYEFVRLDELLNVKSYA